MFYYFALLLIGYCYLLTYLPVSYPYYAHAWFYMCLKYYRPYDHTSNYLSNMKNLLYLHMKHINMRMIIINNIAIFNI